MRNGTVTADSSEQVIVRFSQNGEILQVYKTGLVSPMGFSGLAITANGNLAVGLSSSAKVSNGLGSLPGLGNSDIILQAFDTLTADLFSQARFGGLGTDVISGVAALPDGNVAITGWFSDTASFDGNTLVSKGGVDIFLATTTLGLLSQPASTNTLINKSVSVFPTPATDRVHLVGLNPSFIGQNAQIINATGQMVKTLTLAPELDLKNLKPGFYTLQSNSLKAKLIIE